MCRAVGRLLKRGMRFTAGSKKGGGVVRGVGRPPRPMGKSDIFSKKKGGGSFAPPPTYGPDVRYHCLLQEYLLG